MSVDERKEWEDLVLKLEDKQRLERLLQSEDWSVMHKAWGNIASAAKHNLTVIDPEDKMGIIKLQLFVAFYENVIPKTISEYRLMGEEAYAAAKENNWLGRVGAWLQDKI